MDLIFYKANIMQKKVKGYMCEIDWNWELGEAAGGTTVYATLNDLKENHKCWEECGIVEVEVKMVKQVVKPSPRTSKGDD